MSNRLKILTLSMLGFFVFSTGTVLTVRADSISVAAGNWTGYRTTEVGEGLTGSGGWDGDDDAGFKLAWDITESDGIYEYNYDITGAKGDDLDKALSHFILQVTDGAVFADFTGINEGKLDTYGSEGNSNPGIPGDIFGIKWDTENDPIQWSITFTTERAPVWGDFYAKDGVDGGEDTWVYNKSFGYQVTADETDFTNWIARPNGGSTPVPEPATMLLFGTGLVGLAGVARRRKKK